MELTDKQVEDLKKMLEIQGWDGNWNHDRYMFGMYNGMEMMMSIIENREPVFREKPKEYIEDKVIVWEKPVGEELV